MTLERNFAVETFWRWHPRLYRLSGGRIGGEMAGLPVLLIETRGRRSGQLRETALTYMPYSGPSASAGGSGRESYVVIASVLGEPKHPAWYLNLRADPNIRIQVGAERLAVRARDAEGEEREAIWDQITRLSPDYEQYRAKTDRRIPVVVLDAAKR